MFIYNLELVPSKKYVSLDYTKHKDIFSESCTYINRGLAFTRDQKTLKILSIEREKITVQLESANPLQNPTRSLSALTRFLTSNYSGIFEEYVYNKTLFKMSLINTISDDSDADVTISDAEMLKIIVDLTVGFTSKSESESSKRKKILDQIKDLIKPYIQK